MDACQTEYALTTHISFKARLWYTLVFLIPGMGTLVYVIYRKLYRSSFHDNLKFVMIGYYGSMLFLGALFMTTKIYEIINHYMAETECEVFLNQTAFKYIHIISAVIFMQPMIFPITISIERWIAIWNATRYESAPPKVGPLLVIITYLLGILIIGITYRNEPFEERTISFIFIPSTTATTVFILYSLFFGLNVLNLFSNILLINKAKKLRRGLLTTLSESFQLEEVVHTTTFTSRVVILHFIFFGTFLLLALLFRHFGNLFTQDPVLTGLIKCWIVEIIPAYTCIHGIFAIYTLNQLNSKKARNFQKHLKLQQRGAVVASNYKSIIEDIWNYTIPGFRGR